MENPDRPNAFGLPLTPEDVEEIVSILSKSSYQTLDIETARFRLRVSKSADGWTQEWLPAVGEANAAAAADLPQAQTEAVDDGLFAVRVPLPGTFYRAPQPGAPPFVEVGDHVRSDTVVAIVETMKLMTPVHAGAAGQIVEIIAQNAAPIEANGMLMKLEPA